MDEAGGMQIQRADGFNPNNSKYKSCCCHSKTFTIVVGILEIFTICFILVAVLPDMNSRICENIYDEAMSSYNDSSTNHTTQPNRDIRNVKFLHNLLCEINIVCLVWAIIQILSINFMFYGIKTIRYFLFIPHLFFRFACTIIILLLETWIVYVITGGNVELGPYVTTETFLTFFIIFWLYATWIEIRCAHFIKRSKDTGFSISVARPIGPATISLSEREPQQIAIRQLPPLRHTRTQYMTNDDKLEDS